MRTTILILLGVILLGTFATFAVLFYTYERGDDSLNEDTLYRQAQEARDSGDPLTAASIFHRLIALNPFEKRYETDFLHMLVAIRDFNALAAATNKTDCAFVLTDEEKSVEAAITRGAEQMRRHANDQAVATFASVTNRAFFSVAPFLIQAHASAGRPDQALTLALDYTRRFSNPYILRQAAEWSAHARRRDLVCECRSRALNVRGRTGLSLAHYCDALVAWLDGDIDTMAQAIDDLNGEISTPLSKLMKLQGLAKNGTAETVELAYDELVQNEAPGSKLIPIARAAVKAFLGDRFPKRVTVDEIQRLTTLILDPKNPDADILRLSLLVKSVRGTLLKQELDDALRRFPNDPGLLKIKNQEARL